MFARPSVHRITDDPRLPLAAMFKAVINAGASAVCPDASILLILLIKLSKESMILSCNLKFSIEFTIDYLLYNLSPTILTV
jgi:hypothetical protein